MTRRSRARAAFTTLTLIEVLVVMAIIMFLIGMLLPAVNSVREAARRSTCINNMMQIGIALGNYETIHGSLPPGVVNDTRPIKNIAAGYQYGWMTQILPMVGRTSVYQHFNFSVGVYDAANVTCREVLIGSFLCPSDRASDREIDFIASTNYAGCHHDAEAPIDVTNNGTLFLNSAIRYDDITDGCSQTILVGEKRLFGGEFGWASGNRSTLRNAASFALPVTVGAGTGASGAAASETGDPVGGFSSAHSGGANYLFADGAVRFIRGSGSVLHLLANRADGELLSADKF